MAKEKKKPAKRVFFVSRNMDDMGDIVIRYPFQDATEALWGEFYGSKGADASICEGKSRHWVMGWELGHSAYMEAVERFESAREAGRKSAEAREAKQGTSQPHGGKGFRTEDRTANRRGFGNLSEGGSDIPEDYDTSDDADRVHGDGFRQKGSEGTKEPNGEPKGVRISTERRTELASTHYPVPSSYNGPSNMNLRESACAREEQQKQNEHDYPEDPDELPRPKSLDIYRGGFPGNRKVSDLPPLKPRVTHLPGAKVYA